MCNIYLQEIGVKQGKECSYVVRKSTEKVKNVKLC